MALSGHAERFNQRMTRRKAVFRVDASLAIGAGHVMRCLTLAEALREFGWETRFVCRDHPGHMVEVVRARGFAVAVLPRGQEPLPPGFVVTPRHPAWLSVSWQLDSEQTLEALGGETPDWLVVDHYGLGGGWESEIRPHVGRLLVIDDLAEVLHVPDLLLNQNLGASPDLYRDLLPPSCRLLTGAAYALLRPGFAKLRGESLLRLQRSQMEHLVISMGGVDAIDASSRILAILRDIHLPTLRKISVVMGGGAPWLSRVRALCENLLVRGEVLVNVTDMPALLATADLVIGAAGSSAWERCVLGLPSIMVVVADNQRQAAHALCGAGAAALIEDVDALSDRLIPLLNALVGAPEILRQMSRSASDVCDGVGAARVVAEMLLPGKVMK